MTIVEAPDFEVVRKGDPEYKRGAFRLTTPMTYVWARKRCIVVIPAGTLTDFASIPRGLRNLISINGAHRLPAVLHDYLYGANGTIKVSQLVSNVGKPVDFDYPQEIYYTRKEADKEFRNAMQREGVSSWKARAMYRGVRVFGGLHLKLTGGKRWKKL